MAGRSRSKTVFVEGTVQMSENPTMHRRLEQLLQGLKSNTPRYKLAELSENHKSVLADFLAEITYKESVAPNTKGAYINNLYYLVKDTRGKQFREMTSMDIDLYLQSHHRPLALDPKQKWVNSHNVRGSMFMKFFKWLYYPDLPAESRPKPDVIKNITIMPKPELTNVEAKDLWTAEEDRIFLKYCLDPRISWYHAASDDTSCRPGELLTKRFSDVKIKVHNGKVFGEVEIGRGGKTKSRVVPLIRSLPYFKQLAAANTDPNSYIFRSNRAGYRQRNKPINETSLYNLYQDLKNKYFPSLLERPDIPPEDKEIIKSMLQKPWNPYIRRHTALTEKAKYLNEYNLRLHAGWTKKSKMVEIYTHELGAESSRAILAEMGIMEAETAVKRDLLEPRYCPNCREPNKPDAKFCAKQGCGHPLTLEVYQEAKEREDEAKKLMENIAKELAETKKRIQVMEEFNMGLAEQKLANGPPPRFASGRPTAAPM